MKKSFLLSASMAAVFNCYSESGVSAARDTIIIVDSNKNTTIVVDSIRIAPSIKSEEDAAAKKRDAPYQYSVENADIRVTLGDGGDKYQGLTRSIPQHQMIPPYGLQVTFDKTVHVLFPAPIRYVDLGSSALIAGIAGDASNVLRVKSAEKTFEGETNLTIITESGSFYAFNVKYAEEPEKLSIEMQDFTHDGNAVNRPNNSMDIFLKELQGENPQLVRLIMKSIHKNNYRIIKHIGARGFGIQFLLKGIYSHNGMLYFLLEIKNSTSVTFDIDYLTLKIVDKKLIVRTTIQETILKPVRAYNYVTSVAAKKTECIVMAIPTFTIPDDKKLVFDLNEKNSGGRNQVFEVQNEDLVRAREISNFIIN